MQLGWTLAMIEQVLRQPVQIHEAEDIAWQVYGLKAVVAELPGEYDENFRLTLATGEEFVLKVMHPLRESAFVHLQCSALEWLEAHNPDLLLPRIVRTKDGEPFKSIALSDGSRRLAWLLRFISGKTLVETKPHVPELFRAIGTLLGKVDCALEGFTHPAAKRVLKWDLAQASWIREYLDYVPNGRPRELVDHFFELYQSEVVPSLPSLRTGVIYGDANDYNVLVRQVWPVPLVSVIDFGDMHEGLIASEPSISAAYAMLGKGDVLAAALEIVRGYHHANPLQEEEIAILFSLIATRLVVSVVNSAYRKTLRS